MNQAKLTKWFNDQAPAKTVRRESNPVPKYVVSLGGDNLALRAWERLGYKSLNSKIEANPLRTQEVLQAHKGQIAMAFAFPPAIDLCSAGARWWKKKAAANPNFQKDAIDRLRKTEIMLRATGAPFCVFTPSAPLIKKLWKNPSVVISPHQFSGYLTPEFKHPLFPEIVPRQEAYYKKTFLFTGNGFVLPRRKPVKPEWRRVTSKKTGKVRLVSPIFEKRKHRAARKLSPLGFCQAVCKLHSKPLT